MSSIATRSVGSKASSGNLLFGEIDISSSGSLRSNGSIGSICNLTFSKSAIFLRFWLLDRAREAFLCCASKSDLANLRLVCHDFAGKAAPHLFNAIDKTFTTHIFSRAARMAALERIGKHVRTFTLRLVHSPLTCLPPVIHRETGEEVPFIYTPQMSSSDRPSSRDHESRFGTEEIAQLLMEQYPPLFHAATNVLAFVRAFVALPQLRHLRISCPGLASSHCCRRSIVDYALISLRVALERTALEQLDSLSLLSMHEEGLLFLQPTVAFGASPRAPRRWANIKHVDMRLKRDERNCHKERNSLKILHAYLRNFSSLLSFSFRWEGSKGPFPLSLHNEPNLLPSTCGMGLSWTPALRQLRFCHLRYVEIHNATIDASQISTFISTHGRTLGEFKFEEVSLRTGNWDTALAPLTTLCGSDRWMRPHVESMEVPLILGPTSEEPRLFFKQESSLVPENFGSPSAVYRWLSRRTRSGTPGAKAKAKGRIPGGSGHLRKWVRLSGLAWT